MSQQINLLRPKDRTAVVAIAALALFGLSVVAMLGYHQNLRMQTAALRDTVSIGEKRLGNANNLIKAMQKEKSAQGDASVLTAEIAQLRPVAEAMGQVVTDVGNGSLGRPDGFGPFLETLASVSVDGVWITNINVKGLTGFTITGRALRNDSVVLYARRLNAAADRHGARFKSLELTPAATSGSGSAPALNLVTFRLS